MHGASQDFLSGHVAANYTNLMMSPWLNSMALAAISNGANSQTSLANSSSYLNPTSAAAAAALSQYISNATAYLSPGSSNSKSSTQTLTKISPNHLTNKTEKNGSASEVDTKSGFSSPKEDSKSNELEAKSDENESVEATDKATDQKRSSSLATLRLKAKQHETKLFEGENADEAGIDENGASLPQQESSLPTSSSPTLSSSSSSFSSLSASSSPVTCVEGSNNLSSSSNENSANAQTNNATSSNSTPISC